MFLLVKTLCTLTKHLKRVIKTIYDRSRSFIWVWRGCSWGRIQMLAIQAARGGFPNLYLLGCEPLSMRYPAYAFACASAKDKLQSISVEFHVHSKYNIF